MDAAGSGAGDLVERDLVAGPVIELGRPDRFVSCDPLRVLQRTVIVKVSRYARSAERVAGDVLWQARSSTSTLDHTQHVDAMHSILGEFSTS